MKKVKILLAATSGGHLTQGMRLFQDLPDTELVIFSERSKRLDNMPCKTYSYRRLCEHFFPTMLASFLKSLSIILKEHPDWVISTGAECGTAAILAAKLLFRKTIFVETASRYRTSTASARIVYPLVDHFYVQHKESLKIFGKKAKYIGGVL